MAVKDDDIQEDYTIKLETSLVEETSGTLPDNKGFVPFRFYGFGPFNIRKQTPDSAYRTFIGEQKT
jgi:hypothetical protein